MDSSVRARGCCMTVHNTKKRQPDIGLRLFNSSHGEMEGSISKCTEDWNSHTAFYMATPQQAIYIPKQGVKVQKFFINTTVNNC